MNLPREWEQGFGPLNGTHLGEETIKVDANVSMVILRVPFP